MIHPVQGFLEAGYRGEFADILRSNPFGLCMFPVCSNFTPVFNVEKIWVHHPPDIEFFIFYGQGFTLLE